MNIRHTLPNVETLLWIYLLMSCMNCTSQRSFSALKMIKLCLIYCLTQDRLDVSSLLIIEKNKTTSLNFEDIIEEFSLKKARKKWM